ncbi:MAG: VWA domain-containing protein [Clostridia bacterium]|nr:VWA domain-containing protein [Clostridia bacterium]
MVKSIIWTKKRVIACLLTAVLAVGCLPFFEKGSLADEVGSGGLQPVPNYYTTEGQKVNDAADADITLSKTAERIGPDEWEVTVEAVVGNKPVQKRQLEFVFVMDTSSSMTYCADHDTSHTHDEDCGDLICSKNTHTHGDADSSDCYVECTQSSNPDHWTQVQWGPGNGNVYYQHNDSNSDVKCTSVGNNNNRKYYYLICEKEEHTHDLNCFANQKVNCNPKNIVHRNDGYKSCTCTYDGYDSDSDGKADNMNYIRLNVAKEAAENLISKLPQGTIVHRVVFNTNVSVLESNEKFYSTGYASGTYMMRGINSGIDQFSSDSASKKILVVLTDGESNDGHTSSKLTTFKANGGTVFTIGFSYHNDVLEDVASEDGAYLQASGVDELNFVMDQISSSITAMLEDPMSPSVNFVPGSIDEIKVADGKFETVGETIYWYPQEEGSTVADKTIKYSYTVKLDKNDEAMSAGRYPEIPLNNPTYFLFAVTKTDGNTTTSNTVQAEFPIPKADYSVASLEVSAKCGNTTIYSKDKERIVADSLPKFNYTPAFATSYAPDAYYTDGSKYYRYKNEGTTCTKTYELENEGSVTESINAADIDPAFPAAYVVLHEYEEITEDEFNNVYPVIYQYKGQEPKNAPSCPKMQSILKDTENVDVADEPYCEGYAFSGWTTNDVTVSEDGTFTMPGNQVVFTGTWTKLGSYQVKVNYYTKTDGVAADKPDGTRTTQLQYGSASQTYDFEYPVEWDKISYTADRSLAEDSVSLASFVEGKNKLTDIVPTSPTKTITINLYRSVTTPVPYQVKHEYYLVDLNRTWTPVEADSYTSDPVIKNHGDTVAANSLAADPDGKTDAVKYTEVSRTPDIKLDKTSTEIQTITITYVRYQAPITVHYVDTENTPLKEDYTETLFAGDAYDLNTPVVQIIEILKDGVPYDFAYDDTDDDTGYAGVLPKEGVEITLVYQKRGKATATVQYVDEDGNALQLPLMTEEMYIGEPYDVSEALQVQQIMLGGSEYAFDHHFQTRAPLRSVGSLTFVEDVDYQGAMPPGGIQITRVYRLGKVTYYYQQKNVYTAYDADGNVVYSGTQEFPILTSEVAIATLNALESFEYEGYGFWRVSEETMTADLTGTAPDKPYVFIVYYEFRQGDEPVPDTQLPPGITAPESTPQPTATAPVDTLPPQTGDEGVALWQWLMVLASAGLVLMLKAQRKTRREER